MSDPDITDTERFYWTYHKDDPFKMTPLYDFFRWQERMGVVVTPQNYRQYNLTRKFYQDIKYRAEHEMNIILSIYGQTGSGKSASSLSIALINSIFFKTRWKFDYIKDSPSDIMLAIKEDSPPRGATFIMDEQDTTRAGVNAATMMQMLADLEKRVRKLQWNFIYNSPVPLSHVNHYLLETDGIDREKHRIRLRLYDAIGMFRGYIVVPFPPKKVWDYYNNVFKKNILDDAAEFKSQEEKQLEKVVEEIFQNPVFWALDNNAQRDLYLLKKYPTIFRAKTFRKQFLTMLGIGNRKEYVKEARSMVRQYLDQLRPEEKEILKFIRPSWYEP